MSGWHLIVLAVVWVILAVMVAHLFYLLSSVRFRKPRWWWSR